MVHQIELSFVRQVKKQLLKTGFAIIPNWGTFFLEPVSAYFDERSQRFIPPHYKILFNSKINHHDGVLVISIARELNLPYFDVLQNLKNLTNYWHNKINEYGKIEIKELGVFEQHNGVISFIPENFSITFPEFYGLKELLFENFDIEHSIVFSFPESQQKTIRNWLKAAVIVPIAITFSLLPSKINHYSFESLASFIKKENKQEQLVYISTQDIEKTIDTLANLKIALKPNLKTHHSQPIEEPAIKQKTDEESLTKQTSVSKHYYIIIGSLTTMKQVNEFQLTLEKHHIKGTEVLDCNGKLRIAYKKFENRDDANNALEEFKNNNSNFSGWILYW